MVTMNERIKELAEQAWNSVEDTNRPLLFAEKFAELIVQECAEKLVQANMSNPAYARAMDEYYENKWAHRYD